MYWHVYTSTSTSSHTHVYLQKWTRCRFTTARMGTLITSGERTFVGQSTVKIPSCSQVMEMMKTKECFLSCCLHNGLLLIVPVCLCSPSAHQHVQACDVPFVRPVVRVHCSPTNFQVDITRWYELVSKGVYGAVHTYRYGQFGINMHVIGRYITECRELTCTIHIT